MSSTWGKNYKISLFGESHGKGVGVVIDGLPPGVPVDTDMIERWMARRAPGSKEAWSTKRRESDLPEILSGVYEGKTTGTPLAAFIRNEDTRSRDYVDLMIKPRPGHADLTALFRYEGFADPRGGGHFSGRLTAALVFAGALAYSALLQIFPDLEVYSRLISIGPINDDTDGQTISGQEVKELKEKIFPVLGDKASEEMRALIKKTAAGGDSLGGRIQTVVRGLPKGLGSPMFRGIEPIMASLIFGVPAMVGLEFGRGFETTRYPGSQNNDVPFFPDGSKTADPDKAASVSMEERLAVLDQVSFKTNNSGGIHGGISNGMPMVFQVAVKPTSSIGKEQDTVNVEELKEDKLIVRGRHDPCIAVRAVPVIEACAAIGLLDLVLED